MWIFKARSALATVRSSFQAIRQLHSPKILERLRNRQLLVEVIPERYEN